MGKTYKKIGEKDGKKGIPVRSLKHAEAHGIEIPYICNDKHCISTERNKKAARVAKRNIKSEFENYLDDSDFE